MPLTPVNRVKNNTKGPSFGIKPAEHVEMVIRKNPVIMPLRQLEKLNLLGEAPDGLWITRLYHASNPRKIGLRVNDSSGNEVFDKEIPIRRFGKTVETLSKQAVTRTTIDLQV